MNERDVERYLVLRVKALGGEVRKVCWPARKNAPDRVVMLPRSSLPTRWAEVKSPDTVITFPANAHERAQHREHERMRAAGQAVFVVGTYDQVDGMLR